MMATPHILAGAAVAKVARRPWLAWPAAFGSHFLLDYVPHIDPHTVYGLPGEEPNSTEAAIAIADFAIGAAFLTWLVWRRPERRLVLVGGLCGILIDLIEVSPGLGPWFRHGAGTEWLSTWHHAIQIRPKIQPMTLVRSFFQGNFFLVISALCLHLIGRSRKEYPDR